jgi:hypothetical protein
MDRAVLDAYGWTDLASNCDFFLDYDIDEEAWGNRRKPYRYRWPDATNDRILTHLLVLNEKRHQEEIAAGLRGRPEDIAAGVLSKPTSKTTRKVSNTARKSGSRKNGTLALFGRDEENDS